MLKFYWNGIKGENGKLQPCAYSLGKLLNHPEGTITIYARKYLHFTKEIQDAFHVENDSDGMTDYFENDRIRVTPQHALYKQVLAAFRLLELHNDKRHAKYLERSAA